MTRVSRLVGAVALSCLLMLSLGSGTGRAQNAGLGIPQGENLAEEFVEPIRVRNRQPIAGEEVTILRSFKIEKGSYAEFHRQSVEGIWPYFEKTGARIIGMWQVDHDAVDENKDADYDEAILLTRYASLEHWRASRTPIALGGNGPDAQALAKAHQYRQSVTIETSFSVLRGRPASNGPYYMPAVQD